VASDGKDTPAKDTADGKDTAGADYAERLQRLEGARWKRVLNVQAPYRWNLRRLVLGRTLDVGCGIGRNLAQLPGSVGVDHNATSVALARSRGLSAYTPEQFRDATETAPGTFDSLLLAHVVEHMTEADAVALVGEYLPYLRPGGRVAWITPQEKGYPTDPTHVRFVGYPELDALAAALGLRVVRRLSFPFPRWAGRYFVYNEFVVVAEMPS